MDDKMRDGILEVIAENSPYGVGELKQAYEELGLSVAFLLAAVDRGVAKGEPLDIAMRQVRKQGNGEEKMYAPGTILKSLELGPHGKPVVAVIGYANDWTAYEQSYPWQVSPELIAESGDKFGRERAEELFPELGHLRYRP